MQILTILDNLYNAKNLDQQQSELLFNAIIEGKLSPEQLAGALVSLKIKGETSDEIVGAVKASLNNAAKFDSPDYNFADIVGTGGDGANTINISSASSFVAAACGCRVAKHGNAGVSSKSGSSDVLNALGVDINMDSSKARQALDKLGICFLFAPRYHTGFKHAIPVRQALKTRTIFNILGPLINPARPKHQLLGVYSEQILPVYAQTVAALGYKHSFVVHGSGLDEVALHGSTKVAEIVNGEIETYSLNPSDFGFKCCNLEYLRGGTPEQNAVMLKNLLLGKGDVHHAQAVACNVALLLKTLGKNDLKANAEQAMEIIYSQKASDLLQQLCSF